ncbi:MAG TPA: phosphate/phosphite/phosphonate ABC transporter substrate-binding protein [Firmicutes bacterium]|nr:phosphate/phosphite/phosphonate ABC transporter substrate-binding protein [Bacillota bacterium]
MNRRLLLAAVLLISLVFVPVTAGADPAKLVLGMVPSREADRMIVTLDGLAEMMTEEIGLPVEAYVATSFTGLIEAMGTEKVDIGIFGPAALVMAEDRHGVEIILSSVRRGATSYKSQFNVRADSGIETLEDLRGKTIAFVDPASAGGFQFPYVYLLENGIDPEKDLTYVFAGAHDAGAIGVINGDFDASASFDDVRTDIIDEFPDILDVVKVLDYTEPIPNDGVGVRAGLSRELVGKIQQAFITIGNTEAGKELFDTLYNVTGFAPADGSQYDVVRRTSKIIDERF